MLSKAVLVSAIAGASAFSVPSAGAGLALRGAGVHSVAAARCTLGLRMQEQQDSPDGATGTKRVGASIDADGKSNVWAVEPKIVVEEKGGASAMLAPGLIVGGLVAILGVLAATPLTNPDQL